MPQQDWSGDRTAQPKAKAIGKAARLHAAPGTQAAAAAAEDERRANDGNAGPKAALMSKGKSSAGQAGGKHPAKKPAGNQSLLGRARSVLPAWMAGNVANDSGNQVVLKGRKTGATTTVQPKSDHKARVKRKLEKKKLKRTASGRIVVKKEDRMTVLLKYYPLLVVAHWFGARRFDHVGDGEFDVEDLDDLVEDPGKHLHLCMTRPEPLHITRKKEKDIERRKLKKLTARHKKLGQIEAEHQEGIVHHVLQKMQIDVHSFEEGLMDWDSDDDEDELVRDYYKQHLPVCTFIQVFVAVGLWLGYALQSHPYSFTKYGVAFDQEHALAKYPNNEKSLFGCMRACSDESRCAGFSYLWSYNSSCYLLDTIGGTSSNAYQLFAQYEKGSVSLSSLLTQKAGLESAFPGDTALTAPSFCESGLGGGYSIELWRLLSYQFSHQGLLHLCTNVFVLIVMGIPLEGAHGHSWLFWLYTAGIFGGGLLWLLWDAHELTMGTSAGCMALIGLQIGDFWLNWKDKKLKWTEVCIVTFLLALQVGSYAVGVGASLTSHCTLFGGLLVGLCFGTTFGTNFKETTCERFTRIAVGLFLFISTFGIILYWLVALEHPATSAIWSSESYCWRGQVCIPPEYGGSCTSSDGYQCAQCETRDCVLSWFPKGNNFRSSPPDEDFCGKHGYIKDDLAPVLVGA